jgi:hypothetical protein
MGAWIRIAEHDEMAAGRKDAARIGKSERVESFGQTEGGASGLIFHEQISIDLDPDEISRAAIDAIRDLVTMGVTEIDAIPLLAVARNLLTNSRRGGCDTSALFWINSTQFAAVRKE